MPVPPSVFQTLLWLYLPLNLLSCLHNNREESITDWSIEAVVRQCWLKKKGHLYSKLQNDYLWLFNLRQGMKWTTLYDQGEKLGLWGLSGWCLDKRLRGAGLETYLIYSPLTKENTLLGGRVINTEQLFSYKINITLQICTLDINKQSEAFKIKSTNGKDGDWIDVENISVLKFYTFFMKNSRLKIQVESYFAISPDFFLELMTEWGKIFCCRYQETTPLLNSREKFLVFVIKVRNSQHHKQSTQNRLLISTGTSFYAFLVAEQIEDNNGRKKGSVKRNTQTL